MKWTAGQIGAFLQKPDPSVRIVLIYGPDAGLVHERAENLAKKIVPDLDDPFRVAILAGSAITDDPARLMDEMAAQALGGGRRLVRIRPAVDSLSTPLSALLADMPEGDSFLLIEAGELEKRSKLRALCENDSRMAGAIPCYVEEGPARQRIISDILRELGSSVQPDALAFLGDILPPDRLAMRSELEKLVLYASGQKSISIQDARAVVQDAGAAEIDDLIHAVGIGDARNADVLLQRLFAEQTSPVALLRSAQRHFLRLHWARGQMEQGASAADAIQKLQPPVFWKHKELMSAQLRRWSLPRLEAALDRLYETEASVKRSGAPDITLCAQLFIQMAGKSESAPLSHANA